MNNTTLVGRIASEPELNELADGTKVVNLLVSVQRSYKNSEGEYETDLIKCTLWNGVTEATKNYCRKGDVVGIKGSVQTNVYEDEKGKHYNAEVRADKITFISNTKENKKEKEM